LSGRTVNPQRVEATFAGQCSDPGWRADAEPSVLPRVFDGDGELGIEGLRIALVLQLVDLATATISSPSNATSASPAEWSTSATTATPTRAGGGSARRSGSKRLLGR